MDRLLPIDLDHAGLPLGVRGYKRKPTDALLARASAEIERLLSELKAAHERVALQDQELERFRSQEHTLKESILLAQKMADETRALAHREAEVVREEARQRLSEETRAAEERLKELHWQLEQLELDRMRFRRRMRAELEETLKVFSDPVEGVAGE